MKRFGKSVFGSKKDKKGQNADDGYQTPIQQQYTGDSMPSSTFGNSIQQQYTGSSMSSSAFGAPRPHSYVSTPQTTYSNNPFADPQPPRQGSKASPYGQDDQYEPPPKYTSGPAAAASDEKSASGTQYPSAPSNSREPAIRPLARAGTWNPETETFGNLKPLHQMTKQELNKVFRGIEGLSVLKEVNTVIVVDSSKSIGTYGLWNLIMRVLCDICPVIGRYDKDGFDLYTMEMLTNAPDNHETGIAGGGWNNLTSWQQVAEIFKNMIPSGTTPLDHCFKRLLGVYMKRCRESQTMYGGKRPDPLNIVVVSDGSPDDKKSVKDLVHDAAKELDALGMPKQQLGIQFLMIASMEHIRPHFEKLAATDPNFDLEDELEDAEADVDAANEFLIEIDDCFGENAKIPEYMGVRDIVDTKPAAWFTANGGFDPIVLVQVVVAALIPRFDHLPHVTKSVGLIDDSLPTLLE